MTQKYQVKVSMKQAAIVETGIVLKQGDFGMQIEIEVLDFDITGTTPQIVFRKAMGAVESTTITVSGNKYTYTFKGTELDTPGKCFCDLKLKNSTTQRISTASFMFKVVADTLDGLAEQASSYSDTIEQLLGDVVHLSDTPGLVKNDGSINATIEKDVESQKSAINVQTDLIGGVVNAITGNEILFYGKGNLIIQGQISDITGEFYIGSSANIGAVKDFIPLIIGQDITFNPNLVSCNVYFYDGDFNYIESKYPNNAFSSSVFTINDNQYAYCRISLYKTNIAITDYEGFQIFSKTPNVNQNTIAEAIARLDKLGVESDYIPVFGLLERGSYSSSGVKQNDQSSTQCRTKDKIKTSDADFILLNRSVKDIVVFVDYWDSSDVHKTRITYTSDVTIDKTYAKFAISIIDYSGSSYNNPLSLADAYQYVTICKLNKDKIKISGEADSIPAYTEVLTNYGMECIPIEFENGRINTSTGEDYPNTDGSRPYRIRTVGYLSTTSDYIINLQKKTYYVYIFYYNNAKVFQTSTSAQIGKKITIDKNYAYFRMVIINYDSSSYSNLITPKECYQNIFVGSENPLSELLTNMGPEGRENIFSAYSEVITSYGIECKPILFENGRINTSTGEDYPDTDSTKPYRIRTIGYLSTSADYIIDLRKKEYYVYIFYYDNTKVFQTSTSAQSGKKITIDKNYSYFRLVIINFDNSAYDNEITPEECYLNIFTGSESTLSEILENGEKSEIPNYYNSQLATIKTTVMNHNGVIGKNGASFVFLTDLHWANNQKHSPALVKYIIDNNMVNRIVMGGDYLTDHATKANAMNALDLCLTSFFDLSNNVFPIFGNHDRNSNSAGIDPDKNLTDAEAYSLMNQWMSNEVVNGANYFDFYWDDNKSNTRYIMIDTGAQNYDPSGRISEETFTWLESVLNTDKYIIVFAHWLFSATTWNHPLVDHVLTGNYTESAQRLFDILDNINAGGGKVQAIITGHVHCDYNTETEGGIPIIWTDTDGMQALGDYTATAGTVSEQCIDVISIDYINKKIYCDRIGRGISREISY